MASYLACVWVSARAAPVKTALKVVLLWVRPVAEQSSADELLVGKAQRLGTRDYEVTTRCQSWAAGLSMVVMPERSMSAC
jgi:hypothetical protein